MRALFGALHGNQDATNAFLSAITGAIPLPDFMSTENLGRVMAAAQVWSSTDKRRCERSDVMYVIREILNCKPGKVRQMVEKFRNISTVLQEMGQEPLRVLTDVTASPTGPSSLRQGRIDDFFAMEQTPWPTRRWEDDG